MVVKSTLFWKSWLIANCCLWASLQQVTHDFTYFVIAYSRVLWIISFMEDHGGFPVHSLSVRISSLWNCAQTNVIHSFSSTSTSRLSFIWIASVFSSMGLRSSKRILRTSLDLGLRNVFFTYDSFNFIISGWRRKTFSCLIKIRIISFNTNILSSLKVTRKHLNSVSFSLKFIHFLSLLF